MWNSLSAFYNSQEWRNLRKKLIADRTNKDDGILYDEHNGKPLVNAYDIVLHHVTPLTMGNVNDYSISLNPSNIMIVSHKSHNEIHSRFGYKGVRKVYYIYGAPCSGKTTFVNNIRGNSDIVCDIDNIWECLTGGARYEKPQALKQNMFEVHRCIMDMIKNRFGNWERAFVIDGGAAKTPRNNRIKELGAEPIFIDTDKKTCLKRLQSDKHRTPEQKAEWRKYIDKWFNEYQEGD